MTTLTIKISDKKHAKMLCEILRSMNFVKEVEIQDEYELSDKEIQILEERFEDYKKNPKLRIPLDEVVKKITSSKAKSKKLEEEEINLSLARIIN